MLLLVLLDCEPVCVFVVDAGLEVFCGELVPGVEELELLEELPLPEDVDEPVPVEVDTPP